MALEIKMPQLGESVTEGTIGTWLVKPGDTVKKYQPIAEIITDKVTAELPAPADGVVRSVAVQEGDTVKVGTLIAVMEVAGAVDRPVAPGGVIGDGEATGAQSVQGARAGGDPGVMAARTAGGVTQAAGDAARYSPVVLKLAQQHEIDLSRLTGTGLGGRITRKDVEAHIAAGGAGAEVAPAASTAAPATARAPAGPEAPKPMAEDQSVPVDPIRRRIAEKMVQAKREAPHAWTMITADVTGMVRLREQMHEEFKRREGVSLSYLPFFLKAVVDSLREFPIMNSQWAGDKIIIKKDLHISLAVATDTALAVPVIKHADRLSVAGLAHAVADLAGRARAGKLSVEDISGGTFTVNNTGYFGSVLSQPIINHPQAAILSVELIQKMPVVVENDAIAIRSMVNLCLSLDHRVLDGLVCGRFLAAVKKRVEAYGPGMALC